MAIQSGVCTCLIRHSLHTESAFSLLVENRKPSTFSRFANVAGNRWAIHFSMSDLHAPHACCIAYRVIDAWIPDGLVPTIVLSLTGRRCLKVDIQRPLQLQRSASLWYPQPRQSNIFNGQSKQQCCVSSYPNVSLTRIATVYNNTTSPHLGTFLRNCSHLLSNL